MYGMSSAIIAAIASLSAHARSGLTGRGIKNPIRISGSGAKPVASKKGFVLGEIIVKQMTKLSALVFGSCVACGTGAIEEMEIMWNPHGYPVRADALSDGRLVVATSHDAFILDPATGHRRTLNYPHQGQGWPGIVRVVSGDTILLYDDRGKGKIFFFTPDGHRVKEVILENHNTIVSDLLYSPDMGFLALMMSSGNILRHYDPNGKWINTRGPRLSDDDTYTGYLVLTGKGLVVFPEYPMGFCCPERPERPVLIYDDRGDVKNEIYLSEDSLLKKGGRVAVLGAGDWEGYAYAFLKYFVVKDTSSVLMGHALLKLDPSTGKYWLSENKNYIPVLSSEPLPPTPTLVVIKNGKIYTLDPHLEETGVANIGEFRFQ